MPKLQNEWETSNLDLSYPFENQVFPESLRGVFVDAYIVDGTNLRTDFAEINEQLELTQLTMPDADTATLLQLRYINDNSLFFFTPPPLEVFHYGDFIVIKADQFDEHKHVRLILYEPNIPAFPYTLNIAVDSLQATFVARVHENNLPKINTIEVTDDDTMITHVLSGDIELFPGFNAELSVGNLTKSPALGNTSQRLLTPITIKVIPGAGAGLEPNVCDPALFLKTLDGVGPDVNGNVNLDLVECYRDCLDLTLVSPSVVAAALNTIKVYNDCTACCSCEDYANSYESLVNLQNRAIPIGSVLERVRTDLVALVDDMEQEKQDREEQDVELLVISKPGWIFNIMIIFYNNPPGEDNMPDTLVEFSAGPEKRVIDKSAYVYNPGEVTTWTQYELLETEYDDPATPVPTSPDDLTLLQGNSYAVISYEIFWKPDPDDAPPPPLLRVHDTDITVTLTTDWGNDEKVGTLLEPIKDE